MAETKTIACKFSGCKNDRALTNTEMGVAALSKARELIGVKPFGDPYSVFFGPGYTVTQVIGASHLALSTWSEDREASFTAEIYRGCRAYRAIRFLMNQLDADRCQITEARYYKNGKRVLERTLRR